MPASFMPTFGQIRSEYDWMHPSWRDLVIEHLAANTADRRRFLTRCGLNGVLLALSSAGGREGTRQTPLLVEADDWAALQSRILDILKSPDLGLSTRVILRAVFHAMTRQTKSAQSIVNSSTVPLNRMAVSILEACRTEWNTREHVISSETLNLYYEVSVLLRPLLPGPNLEPTWSAAWEEVREHAEKRDRDLEAWDLAVFEWLNLSEAIQQYEPRFLRQVEFPKNYLEVVRKFMDKVEQDVADEPSFRSFDDYDTEINRLESIEPTIELIRDTFPQLEERTEEVEASIETAKDHLKDDRDGRFSEPPDDYEPREPASRPSGGFDIDEVFEDL